jgi:hypothetical protein
MKQMREQVDAQTVIIRDLNVWRNVHFVNLGTEVKQAKDRTSKVVDMVFEINQRQKDKKVMLKLWDVLKTN